MNDSFQQLNVILRDQTQCVVADITLGTARQMPGKLKLRGHRQRLWRAARGI
jgi:hypothetical protein